MNESDSIYNVSFEGVFNSSHFIYGYELKEELHGHNYIISYKLQTPSTFLNEKLKSSLSSICKEMNNKVLIALNCPTVTTQLTESTVQVFLPNNTFYSFPSTSCYIMTEINSTAECIARFFFSSTQNDLESDWISAKVTVAEIFEQQEAIFKVRNLNT
jgi:6-pyruvoyl-tetrahydropterin synthase